VLLADVLRQKAAFELVLPHMLSVEAPPLERKLAAILAADIVGYSRLMSRDESRTLSRLKAVRTEHMEPALARNGGRLVKLTGDGALIEFGSAVDALRAAVEFQQAMAEANRDQPADAALVFRMGLHVGDLIVDGDDLYGEPPAPCVSGHRCLESSEKAIVQRVGDIQVAAPRDRHGVRAVDEALESQFLPDRASLGEDAEDRWEEFLEARLGSLSEFLADQAGQPVERASELG